MDSKSELRQPKAMVSLAWVSLAGTILILVIKTAAYFKTNSGGVLSDALESLIDIVGAIVTLRVMKAVAEPADADHPYGHGKLEYFSVAFEGGLITLAAILIGFGAIKALIFGGHVSEIESGLGLMALTVVINVLLALYLYRQGKLGQSEAIVAKSKHVLADIITTVAVMIGLALVKMTGLVWIDAVAALGVAFHLVREGSKIVRQAVGGLIDEVDLESLRGLAAAFSNHREPGIIDIHQLKMIRSGRFHHVDVHLVVPEFWNISETHKITDDFEKKVISYYAYDGEVAFHIDPCNREYCRSCELSSCQVRQHKFEKHREFTAESITKAPIKD